MNCIYIVSDGTGKTAEQSIRAALTQFAMQEVDIIKRPGIRTFEQAKDVIEEASTSNGFIVHTVVSDELRKSIENTSKMYSVEAIDLMGPLLAQLTMQALVQREFSIDIQVLIPFTVILRVYISTIMRYLMREFAASMKHPTRCFTTPRKGGDTLPQAQVTPQHKTLS